MPFSIGNRAFAAACGRSSVEARGANTSAWGRRLLAARAGRAVARSYPELLRRQLMNRHLKRWGLPLLDVPEIPDAVMRPANVVKRNARKLAKRRKDYEEGKKS